MDTFSRLSPSFIEGVRPYDPEADRTFGEQLGRLGSGLLSLPSDVMADDTSWRRVVDAAEEQTRAVDVVTSSRAVREDWFTSAADRIKRVSGVDIPPPSLAVTFDPTNLDYASVFERGTMTSSQLEDEFFRKVSGLAGQHPDLADITPDRLQADMSGRAQKAEASSKAVWEDLSVNPWIKGAATFWGSTKGAFEAGDPATLAALLLPAGGKGATLLGRLTSSFLTQAAVGAGVSAASQPAVQAWREEVGLPSGWGEAAQNVAMGALIGGVGGAAVHAGGEAVGAAWRAAKGLASRGVNVTPDMEQALRWAGEMDAANAEMRAARPSTVTEHAGDSILRDGLAAVDDPAAPLPLADAPIASGVTDDLAREALAGSPSLEEALAKVTAAPEVLQSALASADPTIRDLGRVATLDPAIQRRVVDGDLAAAHAAVVAATTSDPALQAAAVAAITEAKPVTVADVRRIASEVVSAERAVSSETAMQRSAPFGPRIDATPETWVSAVDHARSMGSGEIVGALQHPDLGSIDAPWGIAEKYGLAHIASKHPEVNIAELPAIIARASVAQRTARRATLFDGTTELGIKLTFEDDLTGASIGKRWLVTAFEPDGRTRTRFGGKSRPEAHPSQASVSQATADDLSPPARENIRSASTDIKDAVPMLRDDGTLEIMQRAKLQRTAERETWKSAVVAACRA